MKTKINWWGLILFLMAIILTSVLLLSIKGDIVCAYNYPITPKGDCLYGKFALYNFVITIIFFFLKDIKFTKEIK